MTSKAQQEIGKLVDGDRPRDAVHIAVAKVTANERIQVGGRIKLDGRPGHVSWADLDFIGIVDPFLPYDFVEEGNEFFMFLTPNSITDLQHRWEHPAFDDEPVKEMDDREANRLKREGLTEAIGSIDFCCPDPSEVVDVWLQSFGMDLDMTSTQLIEGAISYLAGRPRRVDKNYDDLDWQNFWSMFEKMAYAEYSEIELPEGEDGEQVEIPYPPPGNPFVMVDGVISPEQIWIENFASDMDMTYDRMMEGAKEFLEGGSPMHYEETWSENWPEFWDMYEKVTGVSAPEDKHGRAFTCAC